MKNQFVMTIVFANGSQSEEWFPTAWEARHYARNNISYNGGRVHEVSFRHVAEKGSQTLWKADWDAISKAYGLMEVL